MVKKPCDVEPGRVGGLDKSLDVMGGGKVDGFHPYPEGQEACSEAEPEGDEGIRKRDGRECIINRVCEHNLEEVSRRGYLVAEASPLYLYRTSVTVLTRSPKFRAPFFGCEVPDAGFCD